MICSRCHQVFKPESGDLRPFIFHQCPDGLFHGMINPGFHNGRWSVPKGVSERSKEQRYDYRRNAYDR
jgi:hypothetical protein